MDTLREVGFSLQHVLDAARNGGVYDMPAGLGQIAARIEDCTLHLEVRNPHPAIWDLDGWLLVSDHGPESGVFLEEIPMGMINEAMVLQAANTLVLLKA